MSYVGDGDVCRNFYEGMGRAVAERTILRKDQNGEWTENSWADVAHRVALGNSLLCSDPSDSQAEYKVLHRHLRKATILMSGRHLQHGDETQPERPMEVFTNCATAATSFLLFLLLLSGSGVGRCYDDDLMLVNWDYAPTLRVVLSNDHPDFDWSAHESVRDALHKYGPESKEVMWFTVPDSREGWAQAAEIWEHAAFEKIHKDKLLVLDFSDVRPRGAPIGGMQNRPASGPVPLMNAFVKAASLKGSNMPPWKQAMYVDHYLAECVLVGGARRAARMSTKFWRDPGIFEFIAIKRPIEFNGLALDQVIKHRENKPDTFGFLWSSNNSVTADDEFWTLLAYKKHHPDYNTEIARHARKLWKTLTRCSYGDGTGEPGIINVDKLSANDEGYGGLSTHSFAGSNRYQVREDTELLMSKLARRAQKKKYHYITNPCGEIVLSVLGGYCVIADIVPYHADTLEEVDDALRAAVRALIRCNRMDALYRLETQRTNRIGIGLTGVHEFAYKFFKVGFRELINPNWADHDYEDPGVRAAEFWRTLAQFNQVVRDEADRYADELGMARPHTVTTVKPSGTVSKLFGLTEGWHLPSMLFYLRWVQFRDDDPLVQQYKDNGYPVRKLRTYEGTTIVGFPTTPIITKLGMRDGLVTAADATPEEQYTWLRLGERFWINGDCPEGTKRGNQISYTLKYDPAMIDYHRFAAVLKAQQQTVRVCSVMPKVNGVSYEYVPEEAISRDRYEQIMQNVRDLEMKEEVDFSHVDCASGACPIDFSAREMAAA